MEDQQTDRLESVDIKPSERTEAVLIKMGDVLYDALVDAVRLDEVEILIDAIGEYSTMVSYYGALTSRLDESIGVNLNEAAILKCQALARGVDTEWHVYAQQFKNALVATSSELGLDAMLTKE